MVLNKKNKNILKCRCSEKFLALAAVRFFIVTYESPHTKGEPGNSLKKAALPTL